VNTGGFTAAQAQAVVAQPDFNGIAERGDICDLDFFPFEQSHLQQALHQGIVPRNRLNSAALADRQLIQGGHAKHDLGNGQQVGSGNGGKADENLQTVVQTQAQATAADFEQTGRARLENAHDGAGSKP
jgi:hypothetical protein